MFCKLIHVLEVRACKIEIFLSVMLPSETEPTYAVKNAVNVLLIFLHRIGIVKAHMAAPAVVTRQTEVQADALGVPNMQITVRFRREARTNFGRIRHPNGGLFGIRRRMPAPEPGLIHAGSKIFFNNVADEVGCAPSLSFRDFTHRRIPRGKK